MRNERYRKNAISVRERHNERKNEVYSNPDVLLEYSHNNVTFKACEAATYAQQFDRMVEEGIVSTRGLKPDAYIFDELVFDVNTDYFETHGGYEYAKQFYAEVYELAKEIAGGEQYIISAVMHADERNREASDRLGRDVFHYHLHVVYLPVVEKQIRWSKGNEAFFLFRGKDGTPPSDTYNYFIYTIPAFLKCFLSSFLALSAPTKAQIATTTSIMIAVTGDTNVCKIPK